MSALGIGAWLVTVAAGCEPQVACTEEAVAGANVTVEDEDGNRICDATVQVTGEDMQETLEPTAPDGDCTYVGLYEQEGTFDVDVFKDGYRRVILGDALRIGKTDDGCHVVPESVTVTLEVE